jgi:EAL domain-containing protein (putative c-di-GMP-specific phosphodiesterase class I)
MAMTLDEWVLWKVGESSPITAGQLFAAAESAGTIRRSDWRKVDRALQRLRRWGKIRYDRKGGGGWSVVA